MSVMSGSMFRDGVGRQLCRLSKRNLLRTWNASNREEAVRRKSSAATTNTTSGRADGARRCVPAPGSRIPLSFQHHMPILSQASRRGRWVGRGGEREGGGQRRGVHFLTMWSIGGKALIRAGSWATGRILRRRMAESGEGRGGKLFMSLPVLAGAAAVGGVAYVVVHIEEVPFSGRIRLQSLPPSALIGVGDLASDQLVEDMGALLLPSSHVQHRRVDSIFQRLLATVREMPGLSECAEGLDWKLFVIDSDQFNAFALPNGHIFIHTGFLDVLDRYDSRDDTLASVISHEMSHALLRHASEKLSVQPLADLAGFFTQSAMWFYLPPGAEIVASLFYNTAETAVGAVMELPFSRVCELEADDVGMRIAATACYDPSKVPNFWQFCEDVGLGQKGPTFLSTHPASEQRMQRLNETLPDSLLIYRSSPRCLHYRNAELIASKAREWSRHKDEVTGLTFYVNPKSGVREWSLPPDLRAVRDKLMKASEERGEGGAHRQQPRERRANFPSASLIMLGRGGRDDRGERGEEVPPGLGELLVLLRTREGAEGEAEVVRECKEGVKALMRR